MTETQSVAVLAPHACGDPKNYSFDATCENKPVKWAKRSRKALGNDNAMEISASHGAKATNMYETRRESIKYDQRRHVSTQKIKM